MRYGLNLFLPDGLLVKVTDDFPAPYFRPRALVTLHRLGVIKNLHADSAVGKLLVGMPGIEMDHQIVFLVEGEAADEAAELGLLLVLGLDAWVNILPGNPYLYSITNHFYGKNPLEKYVPDNFCCPQKILFDSI